MESEGKQLPFRHREEGDEGMDDAPTGSGTFAQLLQQAAKLKEAQMDSDRRKYNAWPDYYKASLFPGVEVERARGLPFPQRLGKAQALHAQGLKQLTESLDADGAVKLMGQALAIFRYIRNTDPHIRNKGIRDESLVQYDYLTHDTEGIPQVKALLVECYRDLAQAYLRLKSRAWCVCACDEALRLDPDTVAALVLRARARSSAFSASQGELKLALADLYSATQKDKHNTAVRMEYKRLWHDVMENEKKDRATFQGMFDRGSLSDDRRSDTHNKECGVTPEREPLQGSSSSSRRRKRPAPQGTVTTGLASPPPPLHRRPPVTDEGHSHHNCCGHGPSNGRAVTKGETAKKRPASQEEEEEEEEGEGEEGGPMTMREFLGQMEKLEALAKEHQDEGRAEEAEEVRRTIAECREWLVQERKAAAANKFGLDLEDPRVQECLDRLARGEALPDDEGLLVGGGLGWLCWGLALSLLLVLVIVLWGGGDASATTNALVSGGGKGGGSGWDENEFDEF